MVERVHRARRGDCVGRVVPFFRARLAHPPLKRRVLPKLVEQGFVRQERNVLGVVVRAVAAGRLLARLARVDAL
jgi:hypothetical protein